MGDKKGRLYANARRRIEEEYKMLPGKKYNKT